MTVEKSKLGLEGNDLVAIMDVKCDPEMTSMIIQTYGFLQGYHMNKQHWITILLDGSVSEAKVLDFLDMSYDLKSLVGLNICENLHIQIMMMTFYMRKHQILNM